MRKLLVAAAVAAAPLFLAAPADAQQRGGRWCAGHSLGGDSWIENCRFRSFEACRRSVIAGNKGQCYSNPYLYARSMGGFGRAFARDRRYR